MIIDPYRFVAGGDPNPPQWTGVTLGSVLRNDFSDYVGFLWYPVPPVYITSVARMMVAGNNQVHNIKMWDMTGAEIGNQDVDMAGGTPGEFVWVELATPWLFSGGGQGYLSFFMSQEFSGGDQWYDSASGIGSTGTYAPSINGLAPLGGYRYGGNNNSNGINDMGYGPLNFKWHT